MSTGTGRRVVFVSHGREVGGAEVYLEELIRYLARESKAGWQPELILRRDASVDQLAGSVAEMAQVARLDFGRPSDLGAIRRRLRSAALVHLNLSFPTGKYPFGVAILARSLGRPLVVTHHLGLSVGPPWRQLMKWMGPRAQHIAVSRRNASVLVETYRYPTERVEVIHNGIDARRFHPATAEERSKLKRSAGEKLEGAPWGEGMQIACTVARLSKQKGLFDLVDAAAKLDNQATNLRMVVIGDGELEQPLQERIRALGLGHRLFLLGALPREQVADWLAASDVFVLPSIYEGLPTALMEAMACGRAVVATDVSGTNEVVTDRSVGRLVPPQDPAALAASILDVLSNPEMRAEMGRRARERVLAEFTVEACMRQTEKVLAQTVFKTRRVGE